MQKQDKIQHIIELLMNNHKISQEKKADIFDKIQEMNSSSLDILVDFLENFSEEWAEDALWEIQRRKIKLEEYSEKVLSDAKKEVLEIAEDEENKRSDEILGELEEEVKMI
jgi:hypothetical protein